MENKKFDYEAFKKEAAERLKKSGSMLFKEFLEEALEGELDAHLEEDPEPNRKNGKGKKRVKTPNGEVQIDTPRDRNGTFEPELLPKRQKSLGVDMDRQIIATYVRGASYDDIRDHLMDL